MLCSTQTVLEVEDNDPCYPHHPSGGGGGDWDRDQDRETKERKESGERERPEPRMRGVEQSRQSPLLVGTGAVETVFHQGWRSNKST